MFLNYIILCSLKLKDCVISSKDAVARFTTVPFQPFSDQNVEDWGFRGLKVFNSDNSYMFFLQ